MMTKFHRESNVAVDETEERGIGRSNETVDDSNAKAASKKKVPKRKKFNKQPQKKTKKLYNKVSNQDSLRSSLV